MRGRDVEAPDNSPLLPENRPPPPPPQAAASPRPSAPAKPLPQGSMASSVLGALFGSGGQVSASSIREANAQVEAMHRRITDLERRVQEQMELLERRRQEAAAHYRQLSASKEAELERMRAELAEALDAQATAEERLTEKDFQIGLLLNRCSYLDQAASYAPILDQLSQCLKNAFIAPSKVAQIKPTHVMPHPHSLPPTSIQQYLTGVSQKPRDSKPAHSPQLKNGGK